LSPAYDLNPVPVDLGRRILTTKISLEDGTCDINLVLQQAEYFALSAEEAKAIIKEVATATSGWRTVAAATGASRAEIDRMQSAFEHDDLTKALAF
jgi:serine/threonine-protein kinase HipA